MSTDKADEKTKPGIGEDRRSFVAEVTIKVMKDRPDVIKTIHQWAIVVLDHYQMNRQSYIDAETTRIFKHGDGWLTETYIENSFGFIRDYTVDMGYYISDEDFTGVTLATEIDQITQDHIKKARKLKRQSDKQSYRAITLNERKGTELGIIETKYRELPSNVS